MREEGRGDWDNRELEWCKSKFSWRKIRDIHLPTTHPHHHTNRHTYPWKLLYMHTRVRINMHIRIHAHTHTRVHTHAHTYTHIHTHTHTSPPPPLLPSLTLESLWGDYTVCEIPSSPPAQNPHQPIWPVIRYLDSVFSPLLFPGLCLCVWHLGSACTLQRCTVIVVVVRDVIGARC